MELHKLILNEKQRRELGINQMYYLNIGESIIFLENTESKSIEFLREVLDIDPDKKETELKEIWNIVFKDFSKKSMMFLKTQEAKEGYYLELKIKSKKRKIKKLRGELIKAQEKLKKWKK